MLVELDRQIPRWATPLLQPARYKGASGGRASGKSHFFAEQLVEESVCDPSLRSVCIREVQRSLKFSAKALVEAKIQQLGVSEHFEVLTSEIRRVGGTGVIIFEGMQDHTAETIKSLEGFGRAWVEEAQSISQVSLDMLRPTIREPGSEIWFSWNPKLKTDPVDVMFTNELRGAIRTHNTYLDNPFCPAEMHAEAREMLALDPDKHAHVWEGKYDLGGKGRVYKKFLDKPYPLGNVDASVADHGGEIYIGQDFNVNPMCSVIAQRVVDECHVLDALAIPTSNTVEVCEEIRRRFPKRKVIFCPDPAGNQRRSSTTVVGQTDFTIIRSYGFEVRAPAAHPAVVDRENNANMMFEHEGRRRVRVHPDAMVYIEALNGLTYKPNTSQRDKNSAFDHPCDAGDYLLWQEFNLLKRRGSYGASPY